MFFYKASRIRALHERAGLKILRLEQVGKIFFVVAEPNGGDA